MEIQREKKETLSDSESPTKLLRLQCADGVVRTRPNPHFSRAPISPLRTLATSPKRERDTKERTKPNQSPYFQPTKTIKLKPIRIYHLALWLFLKQSEMETGVGDESSGSLSWHPNHSRTGLSVKSLNKVQLSHGKWTIGG